MPNYIALDTYEANLLNENPARHETVTEIQSRENGELLCYANPELAGFILASVNSREEMLSALQTAERVIEGPIGDRMTGDAMAASGAYEALRIVREAIARANGENLSPEESLRHPV